MARKDFAGSRRAFLKNAGLLTGSAATMMVVGCGDDDDDSATGTNAPVSTPPGTTASSTAAATPRRGGQFTFTVFGDPPNLDLHANTSVVAYYPLAQVYNMLVRFDPAADVQAPSAIVGDLASAWEIPADGLQYTFTLKSGVTFHDGKPLTSRDVKASIERIAAPPTGVVSPRRLQYSTIDSIQTPSDDTVVIKLKRPTAALLTFLASGWAGIYAADDIGGGFDFNTKTNGTGPFILKEYSKGNRFNLEANKSYFEIGKPYLDSLAGFVIPDASAAMASFQTGDLLIWRGPSPSQRKVLEAELGDKMQVATNPSNGIWGLNYGPAEIWRDPRVRQAVTLAMDRSAAMEILGEGQGALGGYLPPHGFWKLPEDRLRSISGYAGQSGAEGLAEAKRLLSSAGVSTDIKVSVLTRQGQNFETFSTLVQDQLSQMGFEAEIQIVETAGFNEALNKRQFDIAPVQQGYALEDPDAIFAESFISKAPRNYSDVSSAEVDDLYARQSQSLREEERIGIVQEMEEKALPLYGKTVLYWYQGNTAWRSNVHGYEPHAGSQIGERYENVWLDA